MPTFMQKQTISTAEQLLGLDEPGFTFELVRGELRRMSGAGHWHGAVTQVVAELLGRHVRTNGLGYTYAAETGFLLTRNPDTVLCPDLAFVRADRVAPEGPGHFPGPPDLAVEVVSPNDSWSQTEEKALSWLAHGARLVWVLDPRKHSVTVFRGPRDIQCLSGDDRLDGGDVVPGFWVMVDELFPKPIGKPA